MVLNGNFFLWVWDEVFGLMVFIYAWSLLAVRSRGAVVFAFMLGNHAQFRPVQLSTAQGRCPGQLWSVPVLNRPKFSSNEIAI